jgi:hypothetical protein
VQRSKQSNPQRIQALWTINKHQGARNAVKGGRSDIAEPVWSTKDSNE